MRALSENGRWLNNESASMGCCIQRSWNRNSAARMTKAATAETAQGSLYPGTPASMTTAAKLPSAPTAAACPARSHGPVIWALVCAPPRHPRGGRLIDRVTKNMLRQPTRAMRLPPPSGRCEREACSLPPRPNPNRPPALVLAWIGLFEKTKRVWDQDGSSDALRGLCNTQGSR